MAGMIPPPLSPAAQTFQAPAKAPLEKRNEVMLEFMLNT